MTAIVVMATVLTGALLGAAVGMVLAYRWPTLASPSAWIGGSTIIGVIAGMLAGALLGWAVA